MESPTPRTQHVRTEMMSLRTLLTFECNPLTDLVTRLTHTRARVRMWFRWVYYCTLIYPGSCVMMNSYVIMGSKYKKQKSLTLTSCHLSASMTTVGPHISHLHLRSPLSLMLSLTGSLKMKTVFVWGNPRMTRGITMTVVKTPQVSVPRKNGGCM